MLSVMIETYFSQDMSKWWEYYKKLPVNKISAYHRPDYFAFQEKIGSGKAVLQIFAKGDNFVYYPGLLRTLPGKASGYDLDSGWYYGGPVASWEPWTPLSEPWLTAIHNARINLGVIAEFIRFEPNAENHILLENYLPVEHNRETVVVDLTVSWESIWKQFSSQNKRNVKKAKANNLIIEKSDMSSSWSDFTDIYQAEMIRKDAPEHLRFDRFFFKQLEKLMNMDLFTVLYHDEVIGGFIAATERRIAHHFLSATKYDYWEIRPNNLLFTEVIKYYHQTKRNFFDFQGGRDGVFRFKGNFSKQRRNFFIGKKIFDEKKYMELSNNRTTNFFPAYRENI